VIITKTSIVCPWVSERTETPINSGATGIGLVQGGKLVAGVMYDRYTGRSIMATIAIDNLLPSKEFWKVIFDYPFNQLAVEKILVTISSGNKQSIRLAWKLGFRLVGVIDDIYDDGDMLIGVLYKHECKWLEKHHGIKSENTQGT